MGAWYGSQGYGVSRRVFKGVMLAQEGILSGGAWTGMAGCLGEPVTTGRGAACRPLLTLSWCTYMSAQHAKADFSSSPC